MYSKDIQIEETDSSKSKASGSKSCKGKFVEELIYENIDLMTENTKLMLEVRELRKKARNLEALYRITYFKNIERL